MRETAPFWSLATLVTDNDNPAEFQVSLEDMIPDSGKLVQGELSQYDAKGTPFSVGDVLFGKLRPYLAKYWLADRDGTAGGDIHVYRPADDVEPRFLNYVVGSRGFIRYTEAASKGVKMPRVEWMGLREFTVHRPNAIVQTRIADYLDRETGEIDAMLGKLDELTELLQVRRDAAVMKAIDSHFKGATVPLAFASDAKNFFDGDWVESRDQDPSGEIRLLQLADIGVGKFLDKSNRRVNQEAFERLACREVFPGDVLIARMPDPLGRACVLPTGLGRSITVVDVAVVRADQAKTIPAYLAYVLNSRRFRTLIESLQGGSTRQRISRSRLGQQRIPAVDLDTQRATVDHLDEVTGKIDQMLAKAAELKALLLERRSALITDVVTGRKEVA